MNKKVHEKIVKTTEKLSKKFPDIPKHDLHLIVRNLLKPKDWPRKFLLRRTGKDKYVF